MSYSLFSLFFGLSGFVALAAWWVGLIGLGKTRRDSAWWIMVVGVSLNSLGIILSIGSFFLSRFAIDFHSWGAWGSALSLFTGIGAPLFGIGFALHGMKSLAAGKRTQELEAILVAQSAELEQLRTTARNV